MSDAPTIRNAFFASVSRTVAQRAINRRMKRLRRDVHVLAIDLARANGTTFEHDLALLQRDIDAALAAARDDV